MKYKNGRPVIGKKIYPEEIEGIYSFRFEREGLSGEIFITSEFLPTTQTKLKLLRDMMMKSVDPDFNMRCFLGEMSLLLQGCANDPEKTVKLQKNIEYWKKVIS